MRNALYRTDEDRQLAVADKDELGRTHCCMRFEEAIEPGSADNRVDAAVHWRRGGWWVGWVQAKFRFCPWCGAKHE